MGFDTSLRLDEKEGGVYHTQWGIFFLKAGVGPNYVSRSVFNHELVHAFQDKVCNYTMNINTRPLVEFEADIATDAWSSCVIKDLFQTIMNRFYYQADALLCITYWKQTI